MNKLNIGDKFWVSGYYTNDDVGDVTEFQVVDYYSDAFINSSYLAKPAGSDKTPRVFTDYGSLDVLGAKVFKSLE